LVNAHREAAPETSVRIGDRGDRYLRISVRGRAHDAQDFWDGNWLTCSVLVALDGFTATVAADLRANEFEAFREALQRICRDGAGTARLDPMEPWLELEVTVEADEGVEVRGWVTDQLGGSNRLQFALEPLRRPDLASVIDDLLKIEARFPVLGVHDL
jgi:hypothetical protein